MRDVYWPVFALESWAVEDSSGLQRLRGYYYRYDDLYDSLDRYPKEVVFNGKYGKAARTAVDEELIRLAGEWVAHP